MNSNDTFPNSAALHTDKASHPAQQFAGDALDHLDGSATTLRQKTVPLLDGVAVDVEGLAQRSLKLARESTEKVRAQAVQTLDTVTVYIKAEPVKAILMAAAGGAVLATLLSWARSSRRAV